MKMVIAVIQPTALRDVKEALAQVGVQRITVCDAQEFAKGEGRIPTFRGVRYHTDILRKITLEIAVNDDFLDRTVETIRQVARTGQRGSDGDGKIFVLPMCEAVQFSPETRGKGAI